MKYLCLIYSDRAKIDALPKDELDALVAEYFALSDTLKQSGRYLGGEALQPVRMAKTIRIRNGKVSMTDGPFAETKEQLGGFYLIDAKDLDDAIRVAARVPAARWGSVEVRPVMEFNQPQPGGERPGARDSRPVSRPSA
jgi:hypothetical protein